MLTVDDVLLALIYAVAALTFCTLVRSCLTDGGCAPEELPPMDQCADAEDPAAKAL